MFSPGTYRAAAVLLGCLAPWESGTPKLLVAFHEAFQKEPALAGFFLLPMKGQGASGHSALLEVRGCSAGSAQKYLSRVYLLASGQCGSCPLLFDSYLLANN